MHTECECKEEHYVAEKDDGKCYGMYLHSPLNTSYILATHVQYRKYLPSQVRFSQLVTDSDYVELNLKCLPY